MKWRCDRCGQVHRRNPSKCRSCGNTVFTQHRGDGFDRRKVAIGVLLVVALIVLVGFILLVL